MWVWSLTWMVWEARKRLCVELPSGNRIRRVETFSEHPVSGSCGTTLAMLCLIAWGMGEWKNENIEE